MVPLAPWTQCKTWSRNSVLPRPRSHLIGVRYENSGAQIFFHISFKPQRKSDFLGTYVPTLFLRVTNTFSCYWYPIDHFCLQGNKVGSQRSRGRKILAPQTQAADQEAETGSKGGREPTGGKDEDRRGEEESDEDLFSATPDEPKTSRYFSYTFSCYYKL